MTDKKYAKRNIEPCDTRIGTIPSAWNIADAVLRVHTTHFIDLLHTLPTPPSSLLEMLPNASYFSADWQTKWRYIDVDSNRNCFLQTESDAALHKMCSHWMPDTYIVRFTATVCATDASVVAIHSIYHRAQCTLVFKCRMVWLLQNVTPCGVNFASIWMRFNSFFFVIIIIFFLFCRWMRLRPHEVR